MGFKGFTLLEIIIVVVIIGIIAAAAAPSLRNFYTQTVQQDATRNIATVLRTAQNLAVIHRVQMQVVFDLDKNKYRIVPDPSLIEDLKVVPRFARTHDLPEGVRFIKAEFNTSEKEDPTDKIRTLNFYANGSSDGGKIIVYGTKLKEITQLEIKTTTGNVIVNTAPIKKTIHSTLQSSTTDSDY